MSTHHEHRQSADTVRSEDRVYLRGFAYKLTAGQVWFAQHYRKGKGFFTSGLEIELSRLDACNYFGKISGFHLATVISGRVGGIPCIDRHFETTRYIVPDRPVTCVRTYVDRRAPLVGIDSAFFAAPGFSTKDRKGGIPLAAVKGVEVYANPAEIPHDLSYPMPADARRCALILIWTNLYWGPDGP